MPTARLSPACDAAANRQQNRHLEGATVTRCKVDRALRSDAAVRVGDAGYCRSRTPPRGWRRPRRRARRRHRRSARPGHAPPCPGTRWTATPGRWRRSRRWHDRAPRHPWPEPACGRGGPLRQQLAGQLRREVSTELGRHVCPHPDAREPVLRMLDAQTTHDLLQRRLARAVRDEPVVRRADRLGRDERAHATRLTGAAASPGHQRGAITFDANTRPHSSASVSCASESGEALAANTDRVEPTELATASATSASHCAGSHTSATTT